MVTGVLKGFISNKVCSLNEPSGIMTRVSSSSHVNYAAYFHSIRRLGFADSRTITNRTISRNQTIEVGGRAN
ncbi:hypothetical protein VrSk94_05970 [Vibrio rotiferianus]